jgi:hypothetical protein
MGWEDPERELARIAYADIGEVYNGMLGLRVGFEYEGGCSQGLGGYMLDAGMVIRVLNAIGVSSLSAAKGRSCWVTHTHDKVLKIEPLHAKDGTPFVIAEWQEWVRRVMPRLSYSDLKKGGTPK